MPLKPRCGRPLTRFTLAQDNARGMRIWPLARGSGLTTTTTTTSKRPRHRAGPCRSHLDPVLIGRISWPRESRARALPSGGRGHPT